MHWSLVLCMIPLIFFQHYIRNNSKEDGLKKFGSKLDSNPDLSNAGAMLCGAMRPTGGWSLCGLIDYMPIDDGCRSLYEFVNARKSCIWTVDWHKGWCVRSSPLMLFFLFFNITCAVMRTLWWGSHTSFKFSLQVHNFHMSTSYNLLYYAVNKILRLYQ